MAYRGESVVIKEININKLKPYEMNAKKHNQKQIDEVANSIENFGIVQPIVIDKDYNVVIGHCRLEALKKLEITTVPILQVSELSKDKVNALRLADNKTNESEWNFELLDLSLEEIDDIDMSLFGFEINDFNFDDIEMPCNECETEKGNNLKVGRFNIPLTDKEFSDIIQKIDDYVEINKTTYGFIGALLNE